MFLGAQEYLLFFSHEGGKNVTRKTYVIAAHDELISCIDVHGTGKDTWMVTGSSDNTVKVWNVASRLRRAIFREASKVLSVAINEKWIVSGSDDGDISVYCAKNCVRLRLLESAHGMDRVWKVTLFEADLFLSAGEDKTLRVTNAESGASVGNTVRVPFKIWDAVVADDGCRFAAVGLRGRAVVVPWAREGTAISPVARKVPAKGRHKTPAKLALLGRVRTRSSQEEDEEEETRSDDAEERDASEDDSPRVRTRANSSQVDERVRVRETQARAGSAKRKERGGMRRGSRGRAGTVLNDASKEEEEKEKVEGSKGESEEEREESEGDSPRVRTRASLSQEEGKSKRVRETGTKAGSSSKKDIGRVRLSAKKAGAAQKEGGEEETRGSKEDEEVKDKEKEESSEDLPRVLTRARSWQEGKRVCVGKTRSSAGSIEKKEVMGLRRLRGRTGAVPDEGGGEAKRQRTGPAHTVESGGEHPDSLPSSHRPRPVRPRAARPGPSSMASSSSSESSLEILSPSRRRKELSNLGVNTERRPSSYTIVASKRRRSNPEMHDSSKEGKDSQSEENADGESGDDGEGDTVPERLRSSARASQVDRSRAIRTVYNSFAESLSPRRSRKNNSTRQANTDGFCTRPKDALDRSNRRRSGPVRYDPSPQEDESEGEEVAMVSRQRPRSEPGLSSTGPTPAADAVDDYLLSYSQVISPQRNKTRFPGRIAQSERMRPRPIPRTGVPDLDRPNRRHSVPVRYFPSSSESPPPLPVRRATPVECATNAGIVTELLSLRQKARTLSPTVISQMSCDELALAIAAFIVSYDTSNGERFDELWPSLLKALQNNDFAGWCLAVRDGDNEIPSVSAQELGHSIVRQLLKDNQATAGVRIGLQRFIAKYMKHLPR